MCSANDDGDGGLVILQKDEPLLNGDVDGHGDVQSSSSSSS